MIFEVVDPGYTWWPWLLGIIPVAMLVLGLISNRDGLWQPLVIVGFFGTLALVFVFGPASTDGYYKGYEAAKVAGIESSGFTNVDLAGDRFSAKAEDGTYFEGVIEEIDTDTFEILELSR